MVTIVNPKKQNNSVYFLLHIEFQ